MRTAVVGKYGEALEGFLVTFDPSMQTTYCKHVARCYTGTAPTLAALRTAYGETAGAQFMLGQIQDFVKYCNYGKEIDGRLFAEAAETLAETFYFLKATEVMLFFRKAKGGAYGDFYGNPSPARIAAAMQQFVRERNFALDKYERKAPPPEASPTAISFEEYKRLRERAENGDEEAREALKPPKR